jgi:hypothetical protein
MSYRISSVMKRNKGQGSRFSEPTHIESDPMDIEVGYRPVFADDHSGYQYNIEDNTFGHLPHMQQTVSQLEACSLDNVARLFDYSMSGSHDTKTHLSDYNETQALEGLHDAQSAEGLHDAQPEDELATQVLNVNRIRTISKYIFL